MATIFDLDGTDLGKKLREIMLSWPDDKPREYLIYVDACLRNNKILKIPKTIKLKQINYNPYHDEKGKFDFGLGELNLSFKSLSDFYKDKSAKSEAYEKSRKARFAEEDKLTDYGKRDLTLKEKKYLDEKYNVKKDTSIGIYDDKNNGFLVVDKPNIKESKPIPEEKTKENIDKLSSSQKEDLKGYTGEYGYNSYNLINKFLREGVGDDKTKASAKNISDALNKSSLGVETTVYRGIEPKDIGGAKLQAAWNKMEKAIKKGAIPDASKILKEISSLKGKEITDKGCMSTSPTWNSNYAQRGLVLAIETKKNDKALDITQISKYGKDKDEWSEKFGSAKNMESEVLFAPNTKLKINKVEISSDCIIARCETITNDRLNRINSLFDKINS